MLNSLTGLRFYAALAVVLSHGFETGVLGSAPGLVAWLDGGRPAVALFFVLSGFVLTLNYANRLGSPDERRAYFTARFARIYPVHVFALLLAAIPLAQVLAAGNMTAMWEFYSIDDNVLASLAASLVAQLGLLTAWLPFSAINQPWNGAAWSISCEMFFYLTLPWLLPHVITASPRRLIGLGLAAWITQATLILLITLALSGVRESAMIYQFPITQWPAFFLGVIAARLFTLNPSRHAGALVAGGLGWCALIATVHGPIPAFWPMLPGFVAVVIGLAGIPTRWPVVSAPAMVLLGNASFALYLIQTPVLRQLQLWGVSGFWGWAALIAMIAASVAVFYGIEEPARRRLRSWQHARVSVAQQHTGGV